MKKLLPIFLVILFGCGQYESRNATPDEYAIKESGMDRSEVSEKVQSSPDEQEIKPTQDPDKKIIKEGHMTIRSDDIQSTKNRIDSLVGQAEGYYAKEAFSEEESRKNYHLMIRIPAAKYESFLKKLEQGPASIENKTIEARDITEEYYDIKARMEADKELEQRLLEILKKANTVEDILRVEQKLADVREEIEAREGRLRYLDSRVSFSTLNVWLYQEIEEKYQPKKRSNFFQRLVRAVHKGWLALLDFLLFVIRLWPFWLLLYLGFRIYRYFRRRGKRKKQQ